MTTKAIELADMIDRSEETTGFERRMASVMRSQAAEIDRLRADRDKFLTYSNECRKNLRILVKKYEVEVRTVKNLTLSVQYGEGEHEKELARKDALLRECLEAWPDGEPNWLPTCDQSKARHDKEQALIRNIKTELGERK